MSSTRQAVVRGPSFTGFGNRPSLTPAHHVDFETGIGPFGAKIEVRRTKPVSGSTADCTMMRLRAVEHEEGLGGARMQVVDIDSFGVDIDQLSTGR
jgi:hypothetical protein